MKRNDERIANQLCFKCSRGNLPVFQSQGLPGPLKDHLVTERFGMRFPHLLRSPNDGGTGSHQTALNSNGS